MLNLDRILLTRSTIKRQFLTIKGQTIEKVKGKMKEERKSNKLDNRTAPKGF